LVQILVHVHVSSLHWSRSVLLSFLYQRPTGGILVITMYQRNPRGDSL